MSRRNGGEIVGGQEHTHLGYECIHHFCKTKAKRACGEPCLDVSMRIIVSNEGGMRT